MKQRTIILSILLFILAIPINVLSKTPVTITYNGDWKVESFTISSYVIYKEIPIFDSLTSSRILSLQNVDDLDIPSTKAIRRIVNSILSDKEKQPFIDELDWRWQAWLQFTVDKQTNRICEVFFYFPQSIEPYNILPLSTLEKLHNALMGLSVYGQVENSRKYFHTEIRINRNFIEDLPISDTRPWRD